MATNLQEKKSLGAKNVAFDISSDEDSEIKSLNLVGKVAKKDDANF